MAEWGHIVFQGKASLRIACWIESRQMVGPSTCVCIFHNNLKSPLVPLDRNVNGVVYRDILRDTLMPFVRQHFAENFPCQEDSSMPHHVRVVTAYLQQGDITKMDQPSRSPDCNLWDELAEIPVERLHGLVTSMLRRLAAIIRAIGGSTQYWMFSVVKHSCGKPTAKNPSIFAAV